MFFIATMTWSKLIMSCLVLGSMLLVPHVVSAQSTSCNRTCKSNNDCSENLICSYNLVCFDDPNSATKVCGTSGDNVAGSCNQTCITHEDCPGKLACMARKCNDDPFMPTHICGINNGCKAACVTKDNCPGNLTCINKECNHDPNVGMHTCDVPGMALAPGSMGTNTAYSSRTLSSIGHVGAWNFVALFFFGPTLSMWLLFLS